MDRTNRTQAAARCEALCGVAAVQEGPAQAVQKNSYCGISVSLGGWATLTSRPLSSVVQQLDTAQLLDGACQASLQCGVMTL